MYTNVFERFEFVPSRARNTLRMHPVLKWGLRMWKIAKSFPALTLTLARGVGEIPRGPWPSPSVRVRWRARRRLRRHTRSATLRFGKTFLSSYLPRRQYSHSPPPLSSTVSNHTCILYCTCRCRIRGVSLGHRSISVVHAWQRRTVLWCKILAVVTGRWGLNSDDFVVVSAILLPIVFVWEGTSWL
jgi:hypothetical protein